MSGKTKRDKSLPKTIWIIFIIAVGFVIYKLCPVGGRPDPYIKSIEYYQPDPNDSSNDNAFAVILNRNLFKDEIEFFKERFYINYDIYTKGKTFSRTFSCINKKNYIIFNRQPAYVIQEKSHHGAYIDSFNEKTDKFFNKKNIREVFVSLKKRADGRRSLGDKGSLDDKLISEKVLVLKK
jgi:hypothetical protein